MCEPAPVEICVAAMQKDYCGEQYWGTIGREVARAGEQVELDNFKIVCVNLWIWRWRKRREMGVVSRSVEVGQDR